MRITVPKPSPLVAALPAAQLLDLGQRIRAQRKALRVNSTATAEAAGVSRVTLHRIEKGEPSVTIGAWGNVMAALGLRLQAAEATASDAPPANGVLTVPVEIALENYPQLKALAWQLHGASTLTPTEALDVYERNARHLEMDALLPHERDLLQALRQVFARQGPHV